MRQVIGFFAALAFITGIAFAPQPALSVGGLPGHNIPFYFGVTAVVASRDFWNPADKSSGISLSNNNLTATGGGGTNEGVRSKRSHIAGKVYWENKITGSTLAGNTGSGFANSSAVLTTVGATPTNAFMAYLGTGNIYVNNVNTGKTLGARAANDVLCYAINFPSALGWVRANAGNWNGTVGADPATNTSGLALGTIFATNGFVIATTSSNVGNNVWTLNVGATAFAQTPPSGYSALQ